MECDFKKGDKVRVLDNAEKAYKYIGQEGTVEDSTQLGVGNTNTKPINTDNTCWVDVKFNDGNIVENIPSQSLQKIE